jgi:hypothetical protein
LHPSEGLVPFFGRPELPLGVVFLVHRRLLQSPRLLNWAKRFIAPTKRRLRSRGRCLPMAEIHRVSGLRVFRLSLLRQASEASALDPGSREKEEARCAFDDLAVLRRRRLERRDSRRREVRIGFPAFLA